MSLLREPVQIEKRRPLTRKEVIQLTLDQEGRCGCGCGFRLDPFGEGVIDEHVIPLEIKGSNALPHRRLFRKPCATVKTNTKDKGDIAKAKRLANPKPPKGTLKGGKFQTKLTKGFDGKVRERKQRTK